ncbi:MAG TPA: hypothetical protein VKQ32_19180 [Polyangia bacterium]|nr:hypothetical protein [Polyangia bacterium]
MNYPRRGEPIVPRLLRPLVVDRRPSPFAIDPDSELLIRDELGAGAWERLAPEVCWRVSMLVIDRVQTRLRSLPAAIRDTPMPAPHVALGLPIERRTSDTLRRALAGRLDGERWTVGRYVKIRRFGGRALVDLLAALEANPETLVSSTGHPGSAADRALNESLLAIARQLPVAEHRLNLGELRHGRRGRPIDVGHLLRSAARLGHELSFRVIELGGTRVVIRLSDLTAARAAYRIAVRTVRAVGVATVEGVARQVQMITRSPVDRGFVEGLLRDLPAFRWLDDEGGWFWFVQRSNPLLANVRKVLSVVQRLSIARLAAVLFRSRTGPLPSPAVVRGVCRAVPEARISDGMVTVDRPLDRRAHLNEEESRVVRFLEAAGRGLSDVQLRWLVREIGLAWTPIWRLLRSSPLFEQSPDGRFCLIGST